MRRLRRAMHDQIEMLRSNEFFHGDAIANIQLGVGETLRRALQPFQVPECVSGGPEELAPHVVVYAGDFMALAVKMLHRFRTDQTAASRNQYLHVANLFPGPWPRTKLRANCAGGSASLNLPANKDRF